MIFFINYFVLNLLNIIIRFMNDVIWLLYDYVVILFLIVYSIYKFFFLEGLVFILNRKFVWDLGCLIFIFY